MFIVLHLLHSYLIEVSAKNSEELALSLSRAETDSKMNVDEMFYKDGITSLEASQVERLIELGIMPRPLSANQVESAHVPFDLESYTVDKNSPLFEQLGDFTTDTKWTFDAVDLYCGFVGYQLSGFSYHVIASSKNGEIFSAQPESQWKGISYL